MVSQIPALYGSGKLESRYMLKAHSIEKLLMFNGNEEWDGSFRVRELSKNEKLRKLLSSILPPDQYSFSIEWAFNMYLDSNFPEPYKAGICETMGLNA